MARSAAQGKSRIRSLSRWLRRTLDGERFAVSLPRVVEPILPILSRQVPVGGEWTYELKLDGFRGTLYLDRGTGRFLSKNKRPLRRFHELAMGIARAMPKVEAIFDGEVVVMGEAGPQFYKLLFGRGVPQYAAFDLLWLGGQDLRPLPLAKRRRALAKLVKNTPVGLVESTADPRLFDVTVEMDLEGIVAKRRADPYGPDTRWVKIKHRGYSQMERRWEYFQRRR
jgi:bifunctional non-homologous end joining protein LigD